MKTRAFEEFIYFFKSVVNAFKFVHTLFLISCLNQFKSVSPHTGVDGGDASK